MAEPLTDDEIGKVRKMIDVCDLVVEEAEYRAARRLVLQTWRKGVIFLGGFIAGLIVLKDYLREALRWLLG